MRRALAARRPPGQCSGNGLLPLRRAYVHVSDGGMPGSGLPISANGM